MAVKYPYRNLILQGGGVKTFGYHGALAVLEENGVLDHIQRVAGNSAGASTAMLLSFRLPVSDTLAILRTLDSEKLTRLAQPKETSSFSPPKILEHQFKLVSEYLDAANRLTKNYGWYSNEYLYQWLQGIIADYAEGKGMATFGDFKALGFRDLYTIAVNLNRRQYQVFSAETTPDVAVADAILMSTALPFFYEPVLFDGKQVGQGDLYVDGGVLNNYPLHLFDDERYVDSKRHFVQGINWESLGMRLYTPPEMRHQHREITGLVQYFQNLIFALIDSQDVPFESNPVDYARSIPVNDFGVLPVDFHIQPVETNSQYQEMVKAGSEAALKFLENQKAQNQPDWLANIEEALGRLASSLFPSKEKE